MDIDIDFPPNFDPKEIFETTQASQVQNGLLKPHPVGFYFQGIPKDKITGLSAIPYKEAEKLGFMKIDFLHLNLLSYFKSKDELIEYTNTEPNWLLLEDEDVVKKLFHLGKHYRTINKIKPRSVMELADVLAIIRPNKIILLDKYLKNPKETRKELYIKKDDSDLRKSHAVPYAKLIVAQLNLISEGKYK